MNNIPQPPNLPTAAAEYDAALDAVCRRLNVNTEHSHANDECAAAAGLVVNGNNEALWQGAKAVGMQCHAIPRNVKDCRDCSACERGCPYGGTYLREDNDTANKHPPTHHHQPIQPPTKQPAKQSTLATFLEDAQASGKLRLVARAHVDKVLRAETGQAIGVIATVQVREGAGITVCVYVC